MYSYTQMNWLCVLMGFQATQHYRQIIETDSATLERGPKQALYTSTIDFLAQQVIEPNISNLKSLKNK